jgi:hypothetical protein
MANPVLVMNDGDDAASIIAAGGVGDKLGVGKTGDRRQETGDRRQET